MIVWIVREAREEHKSVVEWLNNNIAKEMLFFLLEIKAYKIGNFLPAPMFKLIGKPNALLRAIKVSRMESYQNQELNV